jgi:hypothetical protein
MPTEKTSNFSQDDRYRSTSGTGIAYLLEPASPPFAQQVFPRAANA